jgi:uncharacterized protein (TIGR00299 family) protein
MRIGYLEGLAGISGDMLLGALVHAGVSRELLEETVASLHIGATLDFQEVDRSGIQAIKVNVLANGHAAEKAHHQGHHHGHHHGHDESRSLRVILGLIEKTALPKPVKTMAARTFELLGTTEAGIHGVPVESIHFHEIGAVDAIADVVLAATAIHALGIERWHCSPLNVGGGTVECAHGRFPVPAPATAELLRGVPTYSSGIEMELVTPTGAALVRALGCEFGPAPAMRTEKIGYGAGTKNPPGFANVLRFSIGEGTETTVATETITVLETALDDLNPQVIAYVTERALQLGALDVMCTPVQMKKGRSGTLLTILSDAARVASLQDLLLRETSTLGVRWREEQRITLKRDHVTVTTPWGEVRIKRGLRDGQEYNATPEFEECRKIAETHGVPVKRVIETALQVYRRENASQD